MKENIECLRANINSYVIVQWGVDFKRVRLVRGMMGGLFIVIMDENDQKIFQQITAYQREIIYYQVNLVIHHLLNDELKKLNTKIKGPKPSYTEDNDQKRFDIKDLQEWFEKHFQQYESLLDTLKYIKVEDIPENGHFAELTNAIADKQWDDFKNDHQLKEDNKKDIHIAKSKMKQADIKELERKLRDLGYTEGEDGY